MNPKLKHILSNEPIRLEEICRVEAISELSKIYRWILINFILTHNESCFYVNLVSISTENPISLSIWNDFFRVMPSHCTTPFTNKVTMRNQHFFIDFLPHPSKSFGIIIGMNRIPIHHVKILCYKKVTWLNLPNG